MESIERSVTDQLVMLQVANTIQAKKIEELLSRNEVQDRKLKQLESDVEALKKEKSIFSPVPFSDSLLNVSNSTVDRVGPISDLLPCTPTAIDNCQPQALTFFKAATQRQISRKEIEIKTPSGDSDVRQPPELKSPNAVIEDNILLLKSTTKAGRLAVKLARESFFGTEMMKSSTAATLPKDKIKAIKQIIYKEYNFE